MSGGAPRALFGTGFQSPMRGFPQLLFRGKVADADFLVFLGGVQGAVVADAGLRGDGSEGLFAFRRDLPWIMVKMLYGQSG